MVYDLPWFDSDFIYLYLSYRDFERFDGVWHEMMLYDMKGELWLFVEIV